MIFYHLKKLFLLAGLLSFITFQPVIASDKQAALAKAVQTAFSSVSMPEPDAKDPVSAALVIVPAKANQDDHVTLALKVNIAPTWKIYSKVPKGKPFINTTFEIKLPESITAIGDWQRPRAYPDRSDRSIRIHKGENNIFLQPLQIKKAAAGDLEIEVSMQYQACDPYKCLRPTTKTFKVNLLIAE